MSHQQLQLRMTNLMILKNWTGQEKLSISGALAQRSGNFTLSDWFMKYIAINMIKSGCYVYRIHNILGEDIRSLILTSGTLSPFPPIVHEMEIPMPVTLSNPHVIKPYQVRAEICRNGVKNEKMDGRHDNR